MSQHMNLSHNIVVLTATIDPSVGNVHVVLSDKHERLNQYLDNIRNLILKSDFNRIVFCENSHYPHDYSSLETLARQHGKELEILSFMGSNDIIKFKGKSYGEGEILNYAIDNSTYLKNIDATFYKMTGRIFVGNINKILADSRQDDLFIRWDVRKNEVDTRFFKTQVGFYKENLYHLLDLFDESAGMSIEEVYFNVLKGHPGIYSFSCYPEIRGTCASHGRPYDLGLFKSAYRKLQLKTGLLDLRRCS
jgi:hypothetical protein